MTEYVQLPSDHVRGVNFEFSNCSHWLNLSNCLKLFVQLILTLCVTWKRCIYINKSGQETFSTKERR
ncbi:hypothetical protein T09_14968 [Trichinella sp. T9]|nr:hypothetical protein T09_14968 [Trichinella sp. T9]